MGGLVNFITIDPNVLLAQLNSYIAYMAKTYKLFILYVNWSFLISFRLA